MCVEFSYTQIYANISSKFWLDLPTPLVPLPLLPPFYLHPRNRPFFDLPAPTYIQTLQIKFCLFLPLIMPLYSSSFIGTLFLCGWYKRVGKIPSQPIH